MQQTTYYRYDDIRYAGGVDEWGDPIRGDGRSDIILREFEVLSETPCGVWIYGPNGKKFIKTNALRHWAHWSEQGALNSFIARKEKQIRIMQSRIKHLGECLRIAGGKRELSDFDIMIAEATELSEKLGHFK